MNSRKGKVCKWCGHVIYYSRPLKSWRCGPSCDRAEPRDKVISLPKLNWMGTIYSIDFRLMEIRPINKPYEAISFCAMPENLKAEVRGIRFRETTLCYIQGLDD